MSDEFNLHERAREFLCTGKLFSRPRRIWGGFAFGGAHCMLCGSPVQDGEVGYEVEFGGDEQAEAAHGHLHRRCFSVLEAETENLRASPQASPVDDALRPASPHP